MSDPNSPPSPQRRRSSFVDLFTSRPNMSATNPAATNSMSSSPPSAAAVPPSPNPPQHRRGTSITALGLSTNPQGQTSPFGAFAKQRRASVATSSSSGSPEFRNSFGDEPAVLEDDDTVKPMGNTSSSPTLGRRLSFGAQALRDVKQSNGPGSPVAGRRSSNLFTLSESNENKTLQPPSQGQGGGSSGSAKTAGKSRGLSFSSLRLTSLAVICRRDTDDCLGEGFNWSEALRDRTKRSPSFSSGNPFAANAVRPSGQRTTSMAAPSALEPPKEMPKPAEPVTRMKKPDHLGERMLRGDFMMD